MSEPTTFAKDDRVRIVRVADDAPAVRHFKGATGIVDGVCVGGYVWVLIDDSDEGHCFLPDELERIAN